MKRFIFINAVIFATVFSISIYAEQTELPIGGNVFVPTGGKTQLFEGHVTQTRLQLRDMGIAPFDVIPAGQTAITSLAVAPDGKIYGGTTGDLANLFVFSPGHNFIFPLGTIPDQQSIYHSLVIGHEGAIYFGTTLNVYKTYFPDPNIIQGRNWWSDSVTRQIRADYDSYGGGHLYKYDPNSTKITFLQEDFRIEKPCPVIDLGIPVPNEGIYTLLMDEKTNIIYGVTYPGSFLFKYDIDKAKTTVIKKLNDIVPPEQPMPPITMALVQDEYGNIYATGDYAYLVRYNPAMDKLERLNYQLPGMNGRELFNTVTCALRHPDGQIYGGTSDGYLFCFSPKAGKMRNLGKPLMESCIRAVSIDRDGNIYGIGGERANGVCRLFRYDVTEHAFTDLGMLEVTRFPYYEWKGVVFDAMVTGAEGSIYIGNSEHRSRLFIYNP